VAKRVSLSDRRAKDKKGVDVLFGGDQSAQVEEKPKLAKVTLYIRPDQVTAVEDIQLNERKRTGKKPDKSDLIQEALDLLVAKYNRSDLQ
jgi:hypothetical protein